MKIDKFEDLEAWQEARKLVKMVHDTINESEKFKRDYRIRDQATGAALSVMSNIAEGFSRQSNKEFIHFLFIFYLFPNHLHLRFKAYFMQL